MEEAKYLIGFIHDADIRVPCGVHSAAAKPRETHDHNEGGIGWVHGHDEVRGHVGERSDDANPPPANSVVELVVGEGGDGIPDEGGEEDEGDGGEVDGVVCLELWEG